MILRVELCIRQSSANKSVVPAGNVTGFVSLSPAHNTMITFTKEITRRHFHLNGYILRIEYIYHLEKDSVPFGKFYDGYNGSFFCVGETYYNIPKISKWYQYPKYSIDHGAVKYGEIGYGLTDENKRDGADYIEWNGLLWEVTYRQHKKYIRLKNDEREIIIHCRWLKSRQFELDGFIDTDADEAMIVAAMFFLRYFNNGITLSSTSF